MDLTGYSATISRSPALFKHAMIDGHNLKPCCLAGSTPSLLLVVHFPRKLGKHFVVEWWWWSGDRSISLAAIYLYSNTPYFGIMCHWKDFIKSVHPSHEILRAFCYVL